MRSRRPACKPEAQWGISGSKHNVPVREEGLSFRALFYSFGDMEALTDEGHEFLLHGLDEGIVDAEEVG